ncbi:MAG: hypothetical protein QN120_09230 [Armatimonadota bacterium]|nr:hypothetical protein [Armatimonadota bacterium]
MSTTPATTSTAAEVRPRSERRSRGEASRTRGGHAADPQLDPEELGRDGRTRRQHPGAALDQVGHPDRQVDRQYYERGFPQLGQ